MCCGGNCTGNCGGSEGNFTYVRYASDDHGTDMSKYIDKNNAGDLDDIKRCYQSIFVSPIQLDENSLLFPTHFTEWSYICEGDCGCSEGCEWFPYHVGVEGGNRWSWDAGVLTNDTIHAFQNDAEGVNMYNGDVLTIPFFKDANGDLLQSGQNYCFEMKFDPTLFTSPDSSIQISFGSGTGTTIVSYDETNIEGVIKMTVTPINGVISSHTMVIRLINSVSSPGTEIIDFRIFNFRLAPEDCCNPIVHVSDVKLNEAGDQIEVYFSDDHVTTIPVRTNLSEFVNDVGFVTENFAYNDLTFTGARIHNTNGYSLSISSDNNAGIEGRLYLDNTRIDLDFFNNSVRVNSSGVSLITGFIERMNVIASTGHVQINGAYKLPIVDGTSGQYLKTDGAGNLSWQTVSLGLTIGSTPIISGGDDRVVFQSGGVVSENANFTFNGTILKWDGQSTSANSEIFNISGGGGQGAIRVYKDGDSGAPSVKIGSNSNFIATKNSITGEVNNRFYGTAHWIFEGSSSSTGWISVGAPYTPQARLDVYSQGALSTDMIQRWRNSANTANIGKITGDGAWTFGTYTSPNTLASFSGNGFNTGVYIGSGTANALYVQNQQGTGSATAVSVLARQNAGANPSTGIMVGADSSGVGSVNKAIHAYAYNGETNTAGYFDATGGTTNWGIYVQRGDMQFGVSPTLNKIGLFGVTPIVQPTTAIASATVVNGAGTNIKHDDTFDGYTLSQIVRGLKNLGAFG